MNNCKSVLDYAEWLAWREHGLYSTNLPRADLLVRYSVNWNIHKSNWTRLLSQCSSHWNYLSRDIASQLLCIRQLQRVSLKTPVKGTMPDILMHGEVNAIIWSFTSIAVIITALRLYARAVIVKAFGLDDALILVGQVGITHHVLLSNLLMTKFIYTDCCCCNDSSNDMARPGHVKVLSLIRTRVNSGRLGHARDNWKFGSYVCVGSRFWQYLHHDVAVSNSAILQFSTSFGVS